MLAARQATLAQAHARRRPCCAACSARQLPCTLPHATHQAITHPQNVDRPSLRYFVTRGVVTGDCFEQQQLQLKPGARAVQAADSGPLPCNCSQKLAAAGRQAGPTDQPPGALTGGSSAPPSSQAQQQAAAGSWRLAAAADARILGGTAASSTAVARQRRGRVQVRRLGGAGGRCRGGRRQEELPASTAAAALMHSKQRLMMRHNVPYLTARTAQAAAWRCARQPIQIRRSTCPPLPLPPACTRLSPGPSYGDSGRRRDPALMLLRASA